MTILSACADATPPTATLVGSTHPLAGKIWDVRQQRFSERKTVAAELATVDFLLLGERHDNLIHHQHQSWFIRQLRQQQPRASVAFEMIDQQQGQRLAEQTINSTEQLIELLKPNGAGWQYEIRYKGLFAEVLAAGYQISAANMNRQQLMQTVQQGKDKYLPAYRTILNRVPLTAAQTSDLHQEIKHSHCNMLDESAIELMSRAQRLRDVVMAESMLSSPLPVKVLIAGIGHVRNDRGVPIYLAPQAKILSVGFVEVEAERNRITAYNELWDAAQLPFDLVWFTPRVERADPCVQFRQQRQNRPTAPSAQ